MKEKRLTLSREKMLHDLLEKVMKEEEDRNVLFYVTYDVIWNILMQNSKKSATFSSLSEFSKRIMVHWDFSQDYMAFESENAGRTFLVTTVCVEKFKYLIGNRESPDVAYIIDLY